MTVRAAAAIELRPLDVAVVRGYLGDDAGGPVARARWDPVFAVLGTDAPAGRALRTPLMVGLARAIYYPRPGELAGTLRDPAELCDPALGDQTEAESKLYDAFIPAAYRDHTAGRWTARQAEPWLVFLARHLEQTIGSPDLAWWQLTGLAAARAPARRTRISAGGFAAGFAVGLYLGFGLGFLFGFVFGSVLGSWHFLAPSFTGLMARFGRGVVAGIVFGYVGGLVGGLRNGLEAKPSDLGRRSPAGRRGLPVPAHRAAAPPRRPGRTQNRSVTAALAPPGTAQGTARETSRPHRPSR